MGFAHFLFFDSLSWDHLINPLRGLMLRSHYLCTDGDPMIIFDSIAVLIQGTLTLTG
jgi:hypothetical protein